LVLSHPCPPATLLVPIAEISVEIILNLLLTEKTPKHYDLSFFVIVEAHDAYRVFFSIAELMPQNGQSQIWLIWDVNGKPLSGKEAPLRLVNPTGQGVDRWIYGLAGVTLVDGIKPANQPVPGK
jgi:hypothetical protein